MFARARLAHRGLLASCLAVRTGEPIPEPDGDFELRFGKACSHWKGTKNSRKAII